MHASLTKSLPLLAVAALLLTGCSSTQEFSTTSELASAWEDYSGETCDGEVLDGGGVHCNDAVLLRVYQDEGALKDHHEMLREIYPADMENTMLSGPNWSAHIPEGELEDLKKEIGGKIITVKGNDD